jgi:phenylpropionate dioxygenase-like ring-hydroxylating dioxygenase large terminal subunit
MTAIRDLISKEPKPGELTNEAPVGSTIGAVTGKRTPVRVPASRYTSPEFAALELERLWPHVWQVACSTDHVRDPGDFFEYTAGKISVLIVRGDDGALRAFQNVCLHRGNELCNGAGSGLTELRCKYHRWCWDLTGRLSEVPSRKGFGVIRNDDYGLFPVQVDSWGPMVFVNLDMQAESLADFLAPVPDDAAWLRSEELVCQAVVSVPLPCNWKTGIDAFSETYHVQGIHRQMIASTDDVNSPQHTWERHGKLGQPYGVPSPRLRDGATNQEIWESFVATQGGRAGDWSEENPGPHPPLAAGETMRDLIARLIRETAAAKGADLDAYNDAQVIDLHQYNLFPNVSPVFLAEGLSLLRSRPGTTPDDCVLDFFHFPRVSDPDARTNAARPVDVTLPPDQAKDALGLVFRQDIENLERAQRGLHQPGFTHLTLSQEEPRIIGLHRNLERYLGIEPSEVTGGEPA